MQFIDLSYIINDQTPVYPGDPQVHIKQMGGIAKDGFADSLVRFGTHTGTHIDAPAHMISGGKGLGEYGVERFIGAAHCVDMSAGIDVRQIPEGILPGDIVLFYTGMGKHFYNEAYYTMYPVLDRLIIQRMISLRVKMIGLDTGSADNSDGFPVHKALLSADILIIENLANLQAVLGKTFELYALPLHLEKDGAPVRVVAVLQGGKISRVITA